jgi:hypothetical protein
MQTEAEACLLQSLLPACRSDDDDDDDAYALFSEKNIQQHLAKAHSVWLGQFIWFQRLQRISTNINTSRRL